MRTRHIGVTPPRSAVPGIAALALAGLLGAQTPGDSARPPYRPGTSIGPFLAVVFSTLPDQEGYGTRVDFSAGMQWDQSFSDAVFIRSGVFYTGRGGKGHDADFTERYIEFPLLLGYRLPDDVRTRIFVMGGAQVGFLFGCKVNEDVRCSDYGSYQSLDYGVLGGGGVFLPMGQASLVLELRVMQGLHELRWGKNRGVTLGGAYMLPLH